MWLVVLAGLFILGMGVLLLFPIPLLLQFSTRPALAWHLTLWGRWRWGEPGPAPDREEAPTISPISNPYTPREPSVSRSSVSRTSATSSTSQPPPAAKYAPSPQPSLEPLRPWGEPVAAPLAQSVEPHPSEPLPAPGWEWCMALDPAWHGAGLRYVWRIVRVFFGIFRIRLRQLYLGGHPGDPALAGVLLGGFSNLAETFFPNEDTGLFIEWELEEAPWWAEGGLEIRMNLLRILIFLGTLLFTLPWWKLWRSWRRSRRDPRGSYLPKWHLRLALWLANEDSRES